MPGKRPDQTSKAARGMGNRLHRARVLRESWKSANIHVKSGFIWGIPARLTAASCPG
jgi:hypothetical protein